MPMPTVRRTYNAIQIPGRSSLTGTAPASSTFRGGTPDKSTSARCVSLLPHPGERLAGDLVAESILPVVAERRVSDIAQRLLCFVQRVGSLAPERRHRRLV